MRAHARGIPTSHAGLSGAVALSILAAVSLESGAARSQSFVIGNGVTAGQQTMTGAGDAGVVSPAGALETFGAGVDAVRMFGPDQRFTNRGLVETSGGGAINVNSQGPDATILTDGAILAIGDASIGILSEGENARIVNNGSIEALGVATYGIISDASGGRVDNRGFIGVAGAAAAGIIGAGPDLTVSNSGSIEAYGVAAAGILWQNSGLRLDNSGSILVSGLASIGIGAVGNDIQIVNSGAVTVSGAGATGIGTLSGNATVTNSGTVVVDGASAVGIAALGDNSIITNSGRVFSDQSAAIFFGAPGATLNLLGGTALQGPIVFSGGGNTATFGPALNAVMSFAGSGPPQTIQTGGRPFVTSGDTVAVLDTTGFASAGPLIQDLVNGVAGTVEARMPAPSADALAPNNGPDAWISTFGGIRSQGGSGASAGFGEALGGMVAGAERRSGDGFMGGVLLGGAAGSTDVDDDAQEIVHRSVFAGGYLGYDAGTRFAEATFVAGVLQERSRRRVANNLVLGGVETARADFNSIFLSPSVTLGTRLPVAAGTLIPSVRLRYVGLFVDDYAETGSDGDLAVSGRDVNVFEARGQLALALAPARTPGQTWQTTLRAGIDAIGQNSGDLSATLLGQDISFAAGGEEAVFRGFAGADVAAELGAGMTLNAGFEAGYGTDNAFTVRGRARLSRAF
ncbi:autotransporter outer membrane beta-barrel domain-containing protein [Mesorhizobium sp.]|uniref:autotransporter family protein n=1 Tax=Mesorhizobium sp. TaxID=1871066 RepID=UPI000FE36A76|nr:autotransporter outer membrane beta-barrel domain-containing protein [Mesorhizobium sp.]RWB97196.1 MAG: autotransporter domain-containing protein [Mesorhizobium sp.]RWG78100.1 MAG: autotransporter domain-containing protein [Mesorhizobium sp.]RWG79788.1 MAG: autotransporter domain-containing protein [Mesorhizobium sp.]RWJ97288.1 MAG: autotransporter domain-containing protein [Mesorhizobium sp.]RWK06088.1 MAG: autotransporter domain-containing protein [Mesorhizobium sp.]